MPDAIEVRWDATARAWFGRAPWSADGWTKIHGTGGPDESDRALRQRVHATFGDREVLSMPIVRVVAGSGGSRPACAADTGPHRGEDQR